MDRRSTLALAIGLTLLALAGCVPAASPAAPTAVNVPNSRAATSAPAASAPAPPAREPDKVSVALVRSINSASFAVAQGRGYYEAEGLLVEPAEVRSAADTVSALGTGQLDVNVGTISAGTFNSWQRGVKMLVAFPTSIYPADGLLPQSPVARKELVESGAIQTVSDLRGRRVSINVRAGLNELILQRLLDRRGLTIEDVELVTMPFPDMIAALANGSVDAIVPPDPYGTLAIEAGAGVRLMDDSQSVGQLQTTHFLFSENFALNRSDVATRFLLATLRAARELQGDWLADPVLAQTVETELGFKRDLLARSLLPQFPRDAVVRPSDVQVFQDAFARAGHLTYSQPLDVTPFVNSVLATRARELLDARR